MYLQHYKINSNSDFLFFCRAFTYPLLTPWVVPITQIAIMISVYCTVVMSYERYIRVCYLCQLMPAPRLLNHPWPDNVNLCMIATCILPVLFYIPKFFELR